jgi:hypothetical protein
MKVKAAFPNGICMKIITWHNLKVLSWKERMNKWDATCKNLL